MFNKKFEDRLLFWRNFRDSIEDSETPFEDLFEFWKTAPIVNIAADPYEKDTWPSPWEMINENCYCDFVKILAYCYTLQLTSRFSDSAFEIHILCDTVKSETKYLLQIDNYCLGYTEYKVTNFCDLPNTSTIEKSYQMPNLQ